MSYTLLDPEEQARPGGSFTLEVPPPAPRANPFREAGARMPTSGRALMNAAQGPTFGFADELSANLQGGIDWATRGIPFQQARQQWRDIYRGGSDSYQKEHPWLAAGGQIAMSLPMGGALAKGAAMIPGGALVRSAGIGGVSGALTGAGNADEMGDVPGGAGFGALTGVAFGGLTQGVLSGAGAIKRQIAPRVFKGGKTAEEFARSRVAEALRRDGLDEAAVRAKMAELGPNATVMDAAGRNAHSLTDTFAQMPGKTKDRVAAIAEQNKIGRFDMLDDAARANLGTGGARLHTTVAELEAQRKVAADPLYAAFRNTQVPVDDELAAIVERSRPAMGIARRIAGMKGTEFTLNAKPGEVSSFTQLDQLKRGLYDLQERYRDPITGKLNEQGRAASDLRRALIDKMDRIFTDKNGQSLYKAARDAYAGPSELIDAARLGAKAMTTDAWKLDDALAGMSQSEAEAFRIGAMEALRKKVGSQSGQTNLLNYKYDRNTLEKLQALFPDEGSFKRFAVSLDSAKKIKEGAEKIAGRGSQTFERLQTASDEGNAAIREMLGAGLEAKAGNPVGLIDRAFRIYGRARTPESVRDAVGSTMLSRDPNAIKDIDRLVREAQQRAQERAALISFMGPGALRTLVQP